MCFVLRDEDAFCTSVREDLSSVNLFNLYRCHGSEILLTELTYPKVHCVLFLRAEDAFFTSVRGDVSCANMTNISYITY